MERLRRRVADLEEAIEPLLPYATCDNYKLEGQFRNTELGKKRFEQFQRETIYMDLGVFRRIGKLMETRG